MSQRLGDFFNQRQQPGVPGLPVMSVTMNDSLVLREAIARRLESALRPDQHLLVKKGDIAYNMMRMWQGACGLAIWDGMVSPAYVVLAPKPGIDSRFAYHWFKSDRMIHLFWAYSHGLTEDRLRLYFDEFAEIPASPPPLQEQLRISSVMDAWDTAITQTEELLAATRRQKVGFLSHVFGTERNPYKTKGIPMYRLATIHYGKALGSEGYVENGQSPVFGTQGEVGRTNERLFNGPAIIVGRKGTLDKPVLVDSSKPFWAIDTTFVVRPRVSARLLHAFLDYVDLTHLNEASGVPSVSSDNLGTLLVPSDAFENIETIEPLIRILDQTISEAAATLSLLNVQKHGLVQKLLTSEWHLDERFDPPDVASAPEFAEGAV